MKDDQHIKELVERFARILQQHCAKGLESNPAVFFDDFVRHLSRALTFERTHHPEYTEKERKENLAHVEQVERGVIGLDPMSLCVVAGALAQEIVCFDQLAFHTAPIASIEQVCQLMRD